MWIMPFPSYDDRDVGTIEELRCKYQLKSQRQNQFLLLSKRVAQRGPRRKNEVEYKK